MKKQCTFTTLAVILATVLLPLFSYSQDNAAYTQRQTKDSAVLIHFRPGNKMFYAKYHGNEQAIEQVIERIINRNRQKLESGEAFISVKGYSNSFGNKEAARNAVRNRSNQVKSYFISHNGMKESYYRTHNYLEPADGQNDVVILSFLEYLRIDPVCMQRLNDNSCLLENRIPDLCRTEPKTPEEEVSERVYEFTKWYIKSNLLYDAILFPSLEIEYRFNDHWSLSIEGDLTWWKKDRKHKYRQLGVINPEGRYWFKTDGTRRGHYVGFFVGGGWYDLEDGGRGYKGEGFMTGASYGYMFPVGKYLAFEGGLGLGWLHTWYEEYLPIDGCYVYQESKRLNYFGPLKLKFSLVWNIGKWVEKRK